MQRQMTPAEIAALDNAASPPTMTIAQRRERWAQRLERYSHFIAIANNLEHIRDLAYRDNFQWAYSPFEVAFRDEALKADGLKNPTYGEAKRFFAMTDQDIHAFSCDCGGAITNTDMANRIRNLPLREPPVPIIPGPAVDSSTWTG